MIGLPVVPTAIAGGIGALMIAGLGLALKMKTTELSTLRQACQATALQAAKDQVEYTSEYIQLAAQAREAQLERDMAIERAALADSERSNEADRRRMEKLKDAQKQDPDAWVRTPVPDSARQRLRDFQADFANRSGGSD